VILAAAEQLPALPLHTAGKYVAGAYIVLFAIVLIYVAIMAIRLSHMERDLGELLALSERSAQSSQPTAEQGSEPTQQRESTPV
jgi:hypothetical protein